MDTLISSGLPATLSALCRNASRMVVLGAWWVVLIAVTLLTAHHITSGVATAPSHVGFPG
ncbi:DUF5993 family protein [Streptomyces avidinii]|uniref:DUF5993 family protein n=1 Tax=Streptomyces avidinii TaxID=1895 RepID=UPI0038708DE4|nr:DUF5993 family protein [Streptomyces avidinii]